MRKPWMRLSAVILAGMMAFPTGAVQITAEELADVAVLEAPAEEEVQDLSAPDAEDEAAGDVEAAVSGPEGLPVESDGISADDQASVASVSSFDAAVTNSDDLLSDGISVSSSPAIQVGMQLAIDNPVVYALDPKYDGLLQIPEEYTTEYQIEVLNSDGPVTFTKIRGDSVSVDANGLIKPVLHTAEDAEGTEVWRGYYFDTTIIRVTDGVSVKDMEVSLLDYSEIFCRNVITNWVMDCEDMLLSPYEIMEDATRYVNEISSYEADQNDWQMLLISNKGNSEAAADLLFNMLESAGINVSHRDGSFDSWAEKDHENVLVNLAEPDEPQDLYIAEHGVMSTGVASPRIFEIAGVYVIERVKGAISGYRIVQYAGADENVGVPMYIRGSNVVIIGKNAFAGNTNMTNVSLPSTVYKVEAGAFRGCSKLKYVIVPSNVEIIEAGAYTDSTDRLMISGKDVICRGNIYNGKMIFGYAGSDAEAFAAENSIAFYPLNRVESVTLDESWFSLNPTSIPADGSEKKPKIVLHGIGENLVEDVDYTVTYKNNKLVGDATTVIQGIGWFEGTVELPFKITAGRIKMKIAIEKQTYAYTGKAIKPSATVTSEGQKLTKTDYDLVYKNNKAIGEALVRAVGKGKYEGSSCSIKFYIVPRKAAINQAKSYGKKKMTVVSKKDSTVSGYQIEYGLKSDFSGAKKKTQTGVANYKFALTGLTSKKTYYVRIRYFKKTDSLLLYGAWSNTQKVVVK